MVKDKSYLKNILVTAGILLISFVISLLLQHVFKVHEHITAVYICCIFDIPFNKRICIWNSGSFYFHDCR